VDLGPGFPSLQDGDHEGDCTISVAERLIRDVRRFGVGEESEPWWRPGSFEHAFIGVAELRGGFVCVLALSCLLGDAEHGPDLGP
jgi:hypothetical protein